MAHIRPLTGILYANRPDLDFSSVIAPPYDVLDEQGKAQLQAKHPHNIVNIDLPWLPPKTVGPDDVYARAANTFDAWLSSGVLRRDQRAAMYPYTQSFEHKGRTYHRRGFIALVKLSPFGQGQVVPHEKTYQAPIEDRLKLMRATGAQLSPIFGLFSDPRGDVTRLLYQHVGRPQLDGTMDNVRNQLWSVIDADVENKVMEQMRARPIYIADGHHRYTTALQYQKEMEQANGGKPLPPNHPANYCMFVLVAMQDDGLLILPTHRLLGNLAGFDIAAFRSAVARNFDVTETAMRPDELDEYVEDVLPRQPHNAFGLYDARTRKLYQITLTNPDLLKPLEPDKSDAWRKLDVAILQRYLIDEVLQPKFASGEIAKGYTADASTVASQVDGSRYQVAILLKSTPLHALEDLGRHNEVMPQKSTYFYPKLATGMVINPLR